MKEGIALYRFPAPLSEQEDQSACGWHAAKRRGVVDDDDGEMMEALEITEEGEQESDVGGRVFIDAVQADEGVEDEQARAECGDCEGDPQHRTVGRRTQYLRTRQRACRRPTRAICNDQAASGFERPGIRGLAKM